MSTPAAAADSGFPGPYTETPLKGIRKVISERMMHSLASSAQLTYTTTARAQGLLDMRKKLKNSDPALGLNKVTIGDLVGFAAARIAAKHPNHNAHRRGVHYCGGRNAAHVSPAQRRTETKTRSTSGNPGRNLRNRAFPWRHAPR